MIRFHFSQRMRGLHFIRSPQRDWMREVLCKALAQKFENGTLTDGTWGVRKLE